jgi:hypothetical protein
MLSGGEPSGECAIPTFPVLEGDQVALVCAEAATGIVLGLDGERALGDVPCYRVCASRAAAEALAYELVTDFPDRECSIFDRDQNQIATFRPPAREQVAPLDPSAPLRTIVGFVASFPVPDEPPIGRELAAFVRSALASDGLVADVPEDLDWAWEIATPADGLVARTLVGFVGDMDVDPPRQWLVTTTCTIPFLQRLVGRARREAARDLLLRRIQGGLDAAMRVSPRFSHITWYDEASFDRPAGLP